MAAPRSPRQRPLSQPRPPPLQAPLRQKTVPAPVGGYNAVSSLAAMPPTDAPLLVNMLGGENGLRSRLGYQEYAIGLTQGGLAAADPIRTLMSFTGATPADSALFAANKWGIYNVSAGGAAIGNPVVTFPLSTANAGKGARHVVVTSAGHFLAYCDEDNGYYLYKAGVWTKVVMDPAAGTYKLIGFDPALAVFCTVWKHRLWLVERNSANGWYLDLDSIAGTATRFSFAGKFKSGGYLVGLWSWTMDGGAGPDDKLVAVSSEGDVVIYEGTDPSIPGAFGVKGAWNVGAVPSGRRAVTEYGGDLFVLAATGAVPLSRLVLGSIQGDSTQYPTHKITPVVTRMISNYGSYEGWEIKLHPTDNCLMISVPEDSVNPGATQLVLSKVSGGWSIYGGLPIFCMEAHLGKLYFGTPDGRICVNDGYVDNVKLATPAVYDSIPFYGITAFSKMGSLRQKRVQFIRANFTSDGLPPNYQVSARFRFDLSTPTGGSTVSKILGALWDTAKWDQDLWPAIQDFANEQRVSGAVGIGPEVAIAFSGKASARVILIGFDVMYDEGGFL